MSETNPLLTKLQTEVTALTVVLRQANELKDTLQKMMEKAGAGADAEIVRLLSVTQGKLQETALLVAILEIVLGHLRVFGSCDITEYNETWIARFREPTWPTCELNTASSCGKCAFRIFANQKGLDAHLKEAGKKE
jgi:hypothetical protein